MNNADKQYLDIARDILQNGTSKMTRAGEVIGVFDRTVRFNLKDGLPLLTTKKVYTKGILHELLWFLKGDTNIKYLTDNNVNIWTDDAYRYYGELVRKHNENVRIEPDKGFSKLKKIEPVSKEEFLEKVKNQEKELFVVKKEAYLMSYIPNTFCIEYTYGDLGNIYGYKWRGMNSAAQKRQKDYFPKTVDQVQNIIDTLKSNPDDRRMLCVSFDNDILASAAGVALPPCHVMWQVYSREATLEERLEWFRKHNPDIEETDASLLPKRVLSLMWVQRSCDYCAGVPFNCASYGMLLYILADICNMIPGELIGHLEDVHIYKNHIDGINEQLSRKGSETLPEFVIKRPLTSIDDLKFEDFEITGYNPDPVIKYQLNVG